MDCAIAGGVLDVCFPGNVWIHVYKHSSISNTSAWLRLVVLVLLAFVLMG